MQAKSFRFFLQIKIPNQFSKIYGAERYRVSFLPDAAKDLENVINLFKDLPKFEGLKTHVISPYHPDIRPIFGIHSIKQNHNVNVTKLMLYGH